MYLARFCPFCGQGYLRPPFGDWLSACCGRRVCAERLAAIYNAAFERAGLSLRFEVEEDCASEAPSSAG
jgi:hypothetical protein